MTHDPRFVEGVELFNRREFFECHDVLEEYWNDLHGAEKVCIQGLIQAAVGCYHGLNGNYRGSASQFEKSIAKLSAGTLRTFGVDDDGLVDRLSALRDVALQGIHDETIVFPKELIPSLRWISSNEQYA